MQGKGMGSTALVDGKLVQIAAGMNIEDLKRRAGLSSNDSLVEVSHHAAEAQRSSDPVKPSARYRSIPPTTQG